MGATHVTVTIRNPADPDRAWERPVPGRRGRHRLSRSATAPRVDRSPAEGPPLHDVSCPELARRAGLGDWPGFDLLSVSPAGNRRPSRSRAGPAPATSSCPRTNGPRPATSATATGSTPSTTAPRPGLRWCGSATRSGSCWQKVKRSRPIPFRCRPGKRRQKAIREVHDNGPRPRANVSSICTQKETIEHDSIAVSSGPHHLRSRSTSRRVGVVSYFISHFANSTFRLAIGTTMIGRLTL